MLTNKLRELRLKKGIAQNEIADYLKVKRPTYTRYETGTNEPDLNTVARMADYYDVTIDYLLGREEQKEKPTTEGDELSEKQKRMFELFNKVPEEKQDELLTLIEAALKMQGLL